MRLNLNRARFALTVATVGVVPMMLPSVGVSQVNNNATEFNYSVPGSTYQQNFNLLPFTSNSGGNNSRYFTTPGTNGGLNNIAFATTSNINSGSTLAGVLIQTNTPTNQTNPADRFFPAPVTDIDGNLIVPNPNLRPDGTDPNGGPFALGASWSREVYTSSNVQSGTAFFTSNTGSGATAITFTHSVPVQGIYTPVQATNLANSADTALSGWSSARIGGQHESFITDAGNSNSGSVRSYGQNVFTGVTVTATPSAPTTLTSTGVVSVPRVQNGTNTGTGTVVDPTSPASVAANPFLDRALGALASGTSVNTISLTLRNTSGITLSRVDLNFFIEQWRRGNTARDFLDFSYSVGPDAPNIQTDITATGTAFQQFSTFNLVSPNSTPLTVDTPIDGNAAANRTAISGTLPLTWLPNEYLVLRWRDIDSQGNDDGLALDDFQFTATGAAIPGGAANKFWGGFVNNNFNLAANNFTVGAGATNFNANDVANFSDAGLPAAGALVPLNVDPGGVVASQVNVSNTSGTYQFLNGPLTATAGLFKSGAGTIDLSNGANDFGPFGLRASGGTVLFSNDANLGATGGTVLLSGGTTIRPNLAGLVDLSARQVTVSTGGATFDTGNATEVRLGILAGSGGFVKTGPGALRVSALPYAGNFTPTQGAVILDIPTVQNVPVVNLVPAGSWTGDIIFAQTARLNLNPGAAGFTVSGGGRFFVDASGSTLSALEGNANFYTIANPIVLNRNGLSNFQFNVFPSGTTSTVVLTGSVTGNANVNFANGPANGFGVVVINTPLAYTGNSTINVAGNTAGLGGRVQLGVNDGLPVGSTLGFNTSTAFISGSSGSGYLDLNGFSQTLRGLITGSGNAPRTGTALQTADGGINNTTPGNDPFTTRLTLNVPSGETYSYSGNLLGSFSVIKTGAGTQTFSGSFISGSIPANTSNYTGSTEVRAGLLRVGGIPNRLSPLSPLTLGDSVAGTTGRLDLIGINQEVTGLSAAATGNAIVNTGTTAATLTVRYAPQFSGLPATTTYSGRLADGSAALSITKTAIVPGSGQPASFVGTLILNGTLAYSGNTRVEGGELIANRPIVPLTVNPASTLGTVTATGNSRLTIDVAQGSTPTLVLNARSLVADNGATLEIEPVSRVAGGVPHIAVTSALSITTNGFVDLGSSDLIVRNGNVTAIRNAVATWWAGGARNGLGLGATSASAAGFTTLAVFPNSTFTAGVPFYGAYAGITLDSAAVLVRYAYVGDTDVNGVVNGIDYVNLLEGLSLGLTGWQNGDLDYNGVVNVADLNLLNASLGAGLPSLGSVASFGPAGDGSVIPEPAALGLVLPAVALMSRRRR